MNVLNEVMQEDTQEFCYPDEKIASNIYQVSLPYSFRSLAGMGDTEKLKTEKQKREKMNGWLERETEKVHDVPVLDFDNIVRKLANESHSCDALFYNFEPDEGELHYLAEMKDTDSKKKLLGLLETDGKDSIFDKVRDSVQIIKTQLEFGGAQEHDAVIVHTHFFMVYPGKNDVPVRNPISMPRRKKVERAKGKQARAGRMEEYSDAGEHSAKKELEIYENFGKKIQSLGLTACEESLFPGDALPRAKKKKGEGKRRPFSIFSAQDFAKIVDAGFFSEWKWGKYREYFKEESVLSEE